MCITSNVCLQAAAVEMRSIERAAAAEAAAAAPAAAAAAVLLWLLLTSCPHPAPAGARETIRFLPPLNISAAEVEEGLHIFERCLEDVFAPAPVL